MFSKPVLLFLFKAKSLPFLPKSSQNRITCGNLNKKHTNCQQLLLLWLQKKKLWKKGFKANLKCFATSENHATFYQHKRVFDVMLVYLQITQEMGDITINFYYKERF